MTSTWTSSNSVLEYGWYGVTYGAGLFVAIASSGVGSRAMSSPDGITWTSGTTPVGAENNMWYGVTYGTPNGVGLFVAVSGSGSGNRVMTSPDGTIWTSRASAGDRSWNGVTYGTPNGVGLFVAVGGSGSQGRVMTSPDGTIWSSVTTPLSADITWSGVTYGNGLFVAVASSGTRNRVMTSPDGITWTSKTTPIGDYTWNGVTYGNGLFVAVASSGTGNRVMTSPNGETWTLRTTPAGDYPWNGVTYGPGLFVAVASSGTGNRVMTSPNGTAWTLRTSAADRGWRGVTYGNGLFVAVASTGTGNRAMASSYKATPSITGFSILPKTYGDAAFPISQPTSNSPGLFSYESLTPLIATIDGNTRKITIVGAGQAIIRATQAATADYLLGTIDATFTVQGNPSLRDFSITNKTFGEPKFTVTQPTSNNTTGSFTYTSDNLSVATINETTGEITIGGVGQATIRATQAATDYYLSETIDATFTVAKGNPSLRLFSITNKTFGEPQFTVTPPTSNNTTGSFTYTSDNLSVATINETTGEITIGGVGQATIRATQAATDYYLLGTIDALFTVTQRNPSLRDFSITNKTYGEPKFTVTPPTSNNTTGSFTYTSDNLSVATINETTGEITIVGVGQTTIRATQAATDYYLLGFVTTIFRVTPPPPVTFSGSGVLTMATVRNTPSLSGIRSVAITDYEAIGYGAFSYLTNLSFVSISPSVTSIGDYAFLNCSALLSFTVPADSLLTSIGNFAFKGCPASTSVSIPLN